MVSLALQNMIREGSRIALSVGIVTMSAFLIFTTSGIYFGVESTVENMIMEADADLWIMSRGSAGSIYAPSTLPVSMASNLSDIPGVEKAVPLIRTGMTLEIKGKNVLISLNGFDQEDGAGGPWKMDDGRSELRNGEIIIDRVFGIKYRLGIGDSLTIMNRSFEIVGITKDTNILTFSMLFVRLDDALELQPGRLVNIFLVKTSGDRDSVGRSIESAFPWVSARTPEDVVEEAKEQTLGSFRPILAIISIIALVVGTLVIGMIVYTMTIEKAREFGILKAIGARNSYVYGIVFVNSISVSVSGFLIGLLVSHLAPGPIGIVVPEFMIRIPMSLVFALFGAFLVTGILAAGIPVLRISGIDPAIVFRG